jgi:hypothetical protein
MRLFFCLISSVLMLSAPDIQAQPNILGLPAVPQVPVQAVPTAPASAGSAVAKRKPAPAASSVSQASAQAQPGQITDADAKAVLSGGVVMASSYVGTVATVRVTTNNTYPGKVLSNKAIKAARLVQRDLALSCAWQCELAPMPAPKILADDKLQFDMVINNYPRVLSYDDMIAMLLGKPLAVIAKHATAASAPGSFASTPTQAQPAAPTFTSPAQ